MILSAHDSVASQLGTGVLRFNRSTLSGPPFKAEDTLSEGYTDVSSLANWDTLGRLTPVDYKVIRAEIKALYEATTWAALTSAEKDVCARWFVATATERDDVYTRTQQVGLGQLFHAESVETRTLRISRAVSEIYNRLSWVETEEVIQDVNGSPLFHNYVEFGLEGTVEGDIEGLFDYVEARSGTSYVTTGFAAKTWTPNGYADMSAFATAIMDVLKNGNY